MSDQENRTSGESSAYASIRPKDRRCVDEFLINGMIQWRAYRDTIAKKESYDKHDSLRTQSSAYFAKHNIQAAIVERLEVEAMSKLEALHRLAQQARNVQMQYLEEDGTIDLAALLSDGHAHLVKETDYKGKDADRLVIKFYDVQAALDKILKTHGAYGPTGTAEDPQHITVTGFNFEHPDETPEKPAPD